MNKLTYIIQLKKDIKNRTKDNKIEYEFLSSDI